MPDEPTAGRPYMPGYLSPQGPGGLLPWTWAEERLLTSRNYWLGTVYPDGRPHLMPVWCVWLDRQLYFSTGARSRKAKNLRANPRCTISIEDGTRPVVVQGMARLVTDRDERQRMCAPYTAKYDWPLQVTDDGVADTQGNGGPLFAIRPLSVIGMTDDFPQSLTRWRFSDY